MSGFKSSRRSAMISGGWETSSHRKKPTATSTPRKENREDPLLCDISSSEVYNTALTTSSETINSSHSVDKSKDSGYLSNHLLSLSENEEQTGSASEVESPFVKTDSSRATERVLKLQKLKEDLEFKNVLIDTLQQGNNALRLKVAMLENKLSVMRVKNSQHCECCPSKGQVVGPKVSVSVPSSPSKGSYYLNRFAGVSTDTGLGRFSHSWNSSNDHKKNVWTELSHMQPERHGPKSADSKEPCYSQSKDKTAPTKLEVADSYRRFNLSVNSSTSSSRKKSTEGSVLKPAELASFRPLDKRESDPFSDNPMSTRTPNRSSLSSLDSDNLSDRFDLTGKNKIKLCLDEASEYVHQLRIGLQKVPEKLVKIRGIGQDL